MIEHVPILTFLAPFVAAICMPLAGHRDRGLCRPVAIAAVTVMLALSLIGLYTILEQGTVRYSFGGWAVPLGIEWVADPIAAMVLVAVSAIALLSLVYGGALEDRSLAGRTVPYYAILLLLLAGLAGASYAGDLFNIFVFLEVVALSGYALVAVPGGRALVAAFRYLMIGTLGATLYLLGVAYFYAATGALNISDLSQRLPGLLESKAVIGGLLFILIGLAIKMALAPLHGWLPDAYCNAPDAAVPILAGLVTKIALLVWARILFWVMSTASGGRDLDIFSLISSLGILAAVCGGLLALNQRELKRMFAYGGIAHIGLMMIGLGQANTTGLTGTLYYMLNDAVMQCGLFILAGILAVRFGARTLDDLDGASIRSPWVLGPFVVIAVGMVGFPPTGGFFGKWYILLGTLEAGAYVAAGAIILTTLLTLAYFAKVLAHLFRSREPETGPSPVEIAPSLRVSAVVPAVAVIALGIGSDPIIQVLLSLAGGLGQ